MQRLILRPICVPYIGRKVVNCMDDTFCFSIDYIVELNRRRDTIMQSHDNINIKKEKDPNLISSTDEDNSHIKQTRITTPSILFILAVMLIVSITGVQLYRIYVQDQRIQSELQMAEDQNRHLEIYISDEY